MINHCERPEISALDADTQRVLRAIVLECIRAQQLPAHTGIPEAQVLESMLKLIELGHARVETWEDPVFGTGYRVVPTAGERGER